MDAPEHRASTGQAGEDTRPYVNCDDCEVRFYPRAREKLLTGRCPCGFGLHFAAYTFHFAEDAQQISTENFVDIFFALTPVHERLGDLGQVGSRIDAFRRGAA